MTSRYDYVQLAKLLDYPDETYETQVQTALIYFQGKNPVVCQLLEEFLLTLKICSTEQIQETYSAAFDVTPICVPYVSVHLFGEESFKRSQLMTGLAMSYTEQGFDSGKELPDHLRNILRFAPNFKDEDWQELVGFVLVDAVKKMKEKLNQSKHMFNPLISSILEVLQKDLCTVGVGRD